MIRSAGCPAPEGDWLLGGVMPFPPGTRVVAARNEDFRDGGGCFGNHAAEAIKAAGIRSDLSVATRARFRPVNRRSAASASTPRLYETG